MTAHSLLNKLIPTLYEDDRLLAVGKPAGIDVGGLPHETATGLAELLATLRGRNETLHPVNRLSRFESGILLLGKGADGALRIRAALKSSRLEQEYVDRKSTRLNSSHIQKSRMPSSA